MLTIIVFIFGFMFVAACALTWIHTRRVKAASAWLHRLEQHLLLLRAMQ